MVASNYIPVGQTSLVKRKGISLQVQTEYASRPHPRVTTTILNNGQVLYKVEKRLRHPVSSHEEQSRAEVIIQWQHSEVVAIIQTGSAAESHRRVDGQDSKGKDISLHDRLTSIPGFQQIYRLSADGAFIGKNSCEQFKKAFIAVFKHLREVLEIFALLPGGEKVREKGVYEIESDRLYFVSAGSECYFVTVHPTGEKIDYEAALREALFGTE